jgi:hypothetical protein
LYIDVIIWSVSVLASVKLSTGDKVTRKNAILLPLHITLTMMEVILARGLQRETNMIFMMADMRIDQSIHSLWSL